MKILVIVNVSPWSGSLAVTALRLVKAMLGQGFEIAAVYFRGEGVYQALNGRIVDNGTPDMRAAWLSVQQQKGVPLLLCSSAAQRRLERAPTEGFREAGLAEILELMGGCDRLVSF